MLLQGAGILRPVTGCLPAFNAMSCCRMPPFPADAGGGPGQAFTKRCEARDSEYAPHVSHHRTVPVTINTCVLPTVVGPPRFTVEFGGLAPLPLHLEVASFALEVDLALHLVHNQHRPDRAIAIKCPPFASGMALLMGFVVLLLLPSAPNFFAALFLWAATAFHLEASESRNGN